MNIPARYNPTAAMTGEQLQTAVANLAHLLGYLVAHFRPARTERGFRTACQYDAKGFPDLVLVGPRVIYVEIKRQSESFSAEQELWRDKLRACGEEWHCWRPRDWADGSIERVLRDRNPRRGSGNDDIFEGRGTAQRGD